MLDHRKKSVNGLVSIVYMLIILFEVTIDYVLLLKEKYYSVQEKCPTGTIC